MENVGLQIEPLTRSTISNLTGRVFGGLKEAKPQKSFIFSCLDEDSSAFRQKTDYNGKQSMLQFCYEERNVTHYFFG